VAEWPCCHDPLRSSPTSHGFVPPHLHTTLLRSCGLLGGGRLRGPRYAGPPPVTVMVTSDLSCRRWSCMCVHASCIDGQRVAYMHIGFQAKYSLSCPTSPIYNSRSLVTLLLVSLKIVHVLVSVGNRLGINHVQQVRNNSRSLMTPL
jgi:hypothetical protein